VSTVRILYKAAQAPPLPRKPGPFKYYPHIPLAAKLIVVSW
jgi:hypothetical protein